MLRILIFISLIFSSAFIQAQNILKINNPDTSKYEIKEVSKSYFESFQGKEKLKFDTTFTEEDFMLNYWHLFETRDSCYVFEKTLGNELAICRYRSSDPYHKGNSNFKVMGVLCDKVLISTWGYEDWATVTVDLESGVALDFGGMLNTTNCNTAISSTTYYGDEEISLINLEYMELDRLIFTNYSWSTKEVKNQGFISVIKLKSSGTPEEYKYLQITFKQ